MSSNRPPSDEAIAMFVTRPHPISLTPEEIGEDITEAHRGLPVTAWVRFPETPIKVEGKAVAWSESAVKVEFEMIDGRTVCAWVWSGAVRRVRGGQA